MDPAIIITSSLALVLYLNTLDSDFAYDDSRAIQKNQDLEPETPVINVFYDDFWGTPLTHSGSHKSYRPLCVLSFRFNYYMGELNPWGYHLGNVLLHVVVTAIFTHFARLFLCHTLPTLVAGLLFAAHPVHVEAVAGVVGRADVGSCLFFLLATLSYMKYVDLRENIGCATVVKPSLRRFLYFFLAAIFTTASMLTKEQGVMVILVCAAYDLFIFHKVPLKDLYTFNWGRHRRVFEGIIQLGAVGVLLVTFRLVFMGNKPPEFAPSDNPASDSDSLVTRTLTYFLLPVFNVWILLCPRILSFDWSMEAVPLVESVSDPRNMFSVLFYSSLLYLVYLLINDINSHSFTEKSFKLHINGNGVSHSLHSYSHNNNKVVITKHSRRSSNSSTDSEDENTNNVKKRFRSHDIIIISLSVLIFPFIPATNLFFYVGFVIAERVLYIPSMGFCLLVAHGAYVCYRKIQQDELKKKMFILMFVVLITMFSGKTVLRNHAWQTQENLYKSGISVNPAKAWGNLANVWNSQGKVHEAEQAYRKALTHRGNMADTHYNLGILLQDQNRLEEAMKCYKKAIECRPRLSMAHMNLGIIYGQQGRYEEAEKIYRHCANLDTSGLKDPRLHENTKISALYNLGRLYMEQEKTQDALTVFKEALKRRPSYYAPQSIYNMMGEVYMKIGKLEEAEYWYREALKVKQDHVPAHLTMAKLFHKKNQLQLAEQWFDKAKKLDGSDHTVQHHYAQFLADTGRLQESANMYRAAIAIAPDDFELIFNAANALRQVQENDLSEQLYVKAAKLKPHIATAHMNLGAMYHFNGKLAEAEQSYLKALKLKPDDITTQQNLAKLRNLMKSKTTTASINTQTAGARR